MSFIFRIVSDQTSLILIAIEDFAMPHNVHIIDQGICLAKLRQPVCPILQAGLFYQKSG